MTQWVLKTLKNFDFNRFEKPKTKVDETSVRLKRESCI